MKTAINTRTQEEYDALMRYYTSKGSVWQSSKCLPDTLDVWHIRKGNTCIICFETNTLSHSSVEYCRKQSIPVIPYTEFAKANITPDIDYKAKYLEAVELLDESRLQIEYLHGKFKETGTGNSVLSRINQFLTNHKDGE